MFLFFILTCILIYILVGIFATGYWRIIIHSHSMNPQYNTHDCWLMHGCFIGAVLFGLIWPVSWAVYILIQTIRVVSLAFFKLGSIVAHAGESLGKKS